MSLREMREFSFGEALVRIYLLLVYARDGNSVLIVDEEEKLPARVNVFVSCVQTSVVPNATQYIGILFQFAVIVYTYSPTRCISPEEKEEKCSHTLDASSGADRSACVFLYILQLDKWNNIFRRISRPELYIHHEGKNRLFEHLFLVGKKKNSFLSKFSQLAYCTVGDNSIETNASEFH